MSRDQEMVQQLIPGLFASTDVEWSRVVRSRYLVDQTFRYVYPSPIADLRQRLVIEPPRYHGGQQRYRSQFRTSAPRAFVSRAYDEFGNTVLEVISDVAGPVLEFEARIEVERERDPQAARAGGRWLTDPRLLEARALTGAGPRVREAAAAIASEGLRGLALAERVGEWVHGALRYQSGVTTVATTAEEALAAGAGVCQDYAHVMLAICRTLGLPSRYVSGHLLGEGGTHAWVEVLVPASDGSGEAEAHAFDPTHGRPAGVRYVTVAVGRDYDDVAPTSGTYFGDPGSLCTQKRVDIVGLAYE